MVRVVFGGHFWFLRELFISYCITYIGYKILKNGSIVALLCIGFVLFSPFMVSQSFYLPIFFVGILCKEYYAFIKNNVTFVLFISALIFGICLPFWKGEYYGIFLKIFSLRNMEFNFSNFPIGLYRLLTGVSGSVFFFCLFQKIYMENKLSDFLGKFGQYTLEIYILQVIIIETILTKIIDFQNTDILVYSFIITPIMAIMVFIVCIIMIKILKKDKLLNLLLFGHKFGQSTPQNIA
jgi:fucose 4-O-acetylase-like acetyltransferase